MLSAIAKTMRRQAGLLRYNYYHLHQMLNDIQRRILNEEVTA